MFNLIIGVETLAKYGIILDFGTKVITIDKIQSPMKPINAFKRLNFDTRFSREELEPISTREETKRKNLERKLQKSRSYRNLERKL